MNVLIVGGGGREHALGWKLSEGDSTLFFAPGNPGTASLGTNLSVSDTDVPALVQSAQDYQIDLTIVGPEIPLSLGIVDAFQKAGLKIFGPTKAAAQLESSKQFAKEVMIAAGVPTGSYMLFQKAEEALKGLAEFSPPYVIKANGLAAGKGVVVTEELAIAREAIEQHFKVQPEQPLLLEQFLEGREASFIVMTDGKRVIPLPPSNDYKRIFDGDEGPNTGGMGTVSPTAHLDDERTEEVVSTVIQPVLEELKKRGLPFCGFLYAGLMVSPTGGLSVVEFNARMGDPEAQVILRRWNGDLAATLLALVSSEPLPQEGSALASQAAVCVVMASKGYPEGSSKGDAISGISEAESLGNIKVFQAGTAENEKKLLTNGGRVLGVTALGDSVEEARLKAYEAVGRIEFSGKQYRNDIALLRER